jgi:putative ABC transport system ATP-binding protein
MILKLVDVSKKYRQGELEVPALSHVNFEMEEGEYTAVMGPSGSGKSTLMNLIGCLDQATEGEIYLDDRPVSRCSDDEMAEIRLNKIGFIFQSFQLLPYESALENVALPLTYAGVPRNERLRRAEEMLGKVGLSDRSGFLPNQLSGGQKQRVAIARAMINHPKILLADEPTGALDSASGVQIMELFRELNGEGVTILMITHDAAIAQHAEKIAMIRDGVLTGPERAQETGARK